MNDYADDRCPRCDSAECHSAGAYNGVVTAAVPFCAGPPVDWRARALEAEAKVFALQEAARQANRIVLEGHPVAAAGMLASVLGVLDAMECDRCAAAQAEAARLREALEDCMTFLQYGDVQQPTAARNLVARVKALLAAAKGGTT